MKRHFILVSISLFLIFTCLFAACADNPSGSMFPDDTSGTGTPSTTKADYEAQIRDLENQIVELQQNQYISDAEYEKRMAELLEQINALKGGETTAVTTPAVTQAPETTKAPETTAPSGTSSSGSSRFLYALKDGKATVTGYTGNEMHVVIPSAIDGYTVVEVGEGVIQSEKVRSVVISNGITRIAWFAFRDCPNLEAVTIPASVTSIGYSAFASAGKSFTIYCPKDSFAQKYAKSYGLTYTII